MGASYFLKSLVSIDRILSGTSRGAETSSHTRAGFFRLFELAGRGKT